MRDGVRLATDVYGAEPGVRKPVLLLRTPYDKNRSEATALRQVAAGYVAVVQDSRGAFASEGHYIHHNNDDQDGFDTWNGSLASLGRTGMPGCGEVRIPALFSGWRLRIGRTAWKSSRQRPLRRACIGQPI